MSDMFAQGVHARVARALTSISRGHALGYAGRLLPALIRCSPGKMMSYAHFSSFHVLLLVQF